MMKFHERNGIVTKVMDKFTNVKKRELLDSNFVRRYLLRYLRVKRGKKQPNFFTMLLLITLIILM